MELTSRTLIALLLALALLVSARSEAFPIKPCANIEGYPNPPYMALYTGSSVTSRLDTSAHYEPDSNLLYIPGTTDRGLLYRDAEDQFFEFTGRFSLFLNATPSYESSGGIFTLFGTVPQLGIEDDSLLLAANVVGASIGRDIPGCFGGFMQLTMHVDYTNPNLGYWPQYISLLGGLSTLFFPAPDMTDPLGGESWVAGPADYWDIYSLDGVAVPEPGPLSLMVLGLGLLGFAFVLRRCSARSW